MATKTQAGKKALEKLRVIEEDGTPSTDATNDIEAAYDELHPWLLSKSAVNWDVDEDIPDESVRSIVTILAATMADDFGVDEMRYQRLQIEAYGYPDNPGGPCALSTLIALVKNDYIPATIEANYY